MAWQASRFSQDGYVRLFPGVKSGIIIVTERSSRHLFCENQVNEFVLGIGKNVTDFFARNIAVDLRFLQKLESLPRKKVLREKMA